jgi:hypothetical protein
MSNLKTLWWNTTGINPFKGKHMSLETKEKLLKANRGKKLSEEHKDKIRKSVKRFFDSPNGERAKIKIKEDLSKRVYSAETRKIKSECQSGEKGSNWKGGITPINKRIRGSSRIFIWRTAVFERDHYTCQSCGEKGGKLQAHHIKSFSEYPELRFVVKNGITFCIPCHKKTKNYGGKRLKGVQP